LKISKVEKAKDTQWLTKGSKRSTFVVVEEEEEVASAKVEASCICKLVIYKQ